MGIKAGKIQPVPSVNKHIWGYSSAGSPVEAVTHPSCWEQKLNNHSLLSGGIAQLGERLNGIQEVSGSIPLISTIS